MYGLKMFELFYLFNFLRRERLPNPWHKMTADAKVFRDSVISVIIAGVSVTLRK
jgi:hypothetical protein